MFTKLSLRNAFSLALIVLFSTICLFPMGLSAHHHTDHDNLFINNVSAQTMAGASYYHPYVYSGSYANIDNYIGNIPVRYYWSDQLAVYRKGSKNPFKTVSDWDNSSVNPGGSKSFLPWFTIDMTGAQIGEYFAYSDVSLDLKFDFNGDNTWDDGAMVSSSAWLKFDVKRPKR